MIQNQRLDAVADITMGQAPEGESYNIDGQGLPLIAGAGDFGQLHPAPKKFTTAPGKTCQLGDVILGIRATIGEKVLADGTYCLGRGVAGLRVRSGLDDRSLWHWLTHVTPTLAAKAKGATFKQVNREDIGELRIPLPPLVEQRRIAAILDKADALRAKRRAALAKLDTLTQSIFLDMFGDVVKNDRNWPTRPMGALMRIRRGGSPRPIEKYLGGEINWIKIGDATRGSDIYLENCADKITKEGLSKTVYLKAGSLIFANCRVSLGFARILKMDGCIHDGWLSFEDIAENMLDKLFLLKALNSITEHFRTIAPAGTQPNLNTGLMKNFQIILPPIALQHEFALRLAQVEVFKETQRASLVGLEGFFASLQHRAFRGDL